MSVHDLSKLNREELKTFVDSFDTVLTDCDGVLWLTTAFPGSADAINKLKELGKKVFFVSNNALSTLDQYVSKFSKLGYKVQKEEVIIPSVVIASYLKQIGFKKKAFVIGSKAFKHILETEGIVCSDTDNDILEETINGFVNQLESLDTDVGAVILDFDPNLNYMKLMQATKFLKRKDCIFIVGATDHYMPLTEDITLIGPGPFLTILQDSTGRKPIIAGKPSLLVKEVISKRYPINVDRTLMIGDTMAQDIGFGKECGFQTLLVLSGCSTLKDAIQDPNNRPNFYINTLGDLLPLLHKL